MIMILLKIKRILISIKDIQDLMNIFQKIKINQVKIFVEQI